MTDRRYTAEEMEREAAEGFDAFGPEFTKDADMLHQAAATERARVSEAAQTCESCMFAAVIRQDHNFIVCNLASNAKSRQRFGESWEGPSMQVNYDEHVVPLTINGRPFSCAGWKEKV